MNTSIQVVLLIPEGLGLSEAQYAGLSAATGIGTVVDGISATYAEYVSVEDLPTSYTRTTVDDVVRVEIDLGDGETFSYDEGFVVSDTIEVVANLPEAVAYLEEV